MPRFRSWRKPCCNIDPARFSTWGWALAEEVSSCANGWIWAFDPGGPILWGSRPGPITAILSGISTTWFTCRRLSSLPAPAPSLSIVFCWATWWSILKKMRDERSSHPSSHWLQQEGRFCWQRRQHSVRKKLCMETSGNGTAHCGHRTISSSLDFKSNVRAGVIITAENASLAGGETERFQRAWNDKL